jgi:hypothetical protein
MKKSSELKIQLNEKQSFTKNKKLKKVVILE